MDPEWISFFLSDARSLGREPLAFAGAEPENGAVFGASKPTAMRYHNTTGIKLLSQVGIHII